jgi:hypothetical protein
MAFVVIAVLLALFTPIADPRRLSVNDQVARLKAGRVSAEAFDYKALRFDDGRYGAEALERLKADKNATVARLAGEASNRTSRYSGDEPPPSRLAEIAVYPKGRTLPEGFLRGNGGGRLSSTCLYSPGLCAIVLLDVDGDGVEEVLVSDGVSVDIFGGRGGLWRQTGVASRCGAGNVSEAFKSGDPRLAPPVARRDILVGGVRLQVQPTRDGCEAPATAPPLKDGVVEMGKR